MDNQSQAPPPSTAPAAVPSQQTQNVMGIPQPQPSMMQPQPLGGIPPPGGNTSKGLGIKCAYLILGLLAMALTLAALKKAIYYESVCIDSVKSQLANTKRPGLALGKDVEEFTCEEYTSFSHDQCKYFERAHDTNVKQYKEKGGSVPDGYRVPSCPSKWMVEPQVYMLAITWVGGLIAIITTIVLSHQRSADPKLSKLDSMVLFVIGGITLLCALLMMIFFIWMVSSDFWCGHEGIGQEGILCHEKFAWSSFSIEGFFGGKRGKRNCYRFGVSSTYAGSRSKLVLSQSKDRGFDEKRVYDVTDCSSFNTEVYQPWLLLVGTLFAAAAGIVAIVGGVILMKKSGPSQGVGMGAGGQYNSLGLQNNNMGMMGNKSMGPYQQTSQMQMAGGSQYPQPQQQYGYGNQPQNMQMMGQQQQQYGQPTPSWQAMQAQAAQQYRAGRGGPR